MFRHEMIARDKHRVRQWDPVEVSLVCGELIREFSDVDRFQVLRTVHGVACYMNPADGPSGLRAAAHLSLSFKRRMGRGLANSGGRALPCFSR